MPIVDQLDESEKRVFTKTVARINEENDISPEHALAYFKQLTPRQKEVMAKVVELSKQAGEATDRQLLAFRRFGYDV